MSLSDFKEKLIANAKGMSKKKYLIYFTLMIILSTSFWAFTREISSAIFSLIIIVDLIFDLLGYFKGTEVTEDIPIAKK